MNEGESQIAHVRYHLERIPAEDVWAIFAKADIADIM
jgi:hypothetical protein